MEEGKDLLTGSRSAKSDAKSTGKVTSMECLGIPAQYRGIRKRSFDDAQSRLKSRKILGMGGKEPSKVLQVLGNCEHLDTKLPKGLSVWLVLSSLMFFAMSVGCLLLFKPFAYVMGVDYSSRMTVIEVRLLGATFAGLAGLTWLTYPTSYLVIRNVLLSHMMYFGLASFVFLREIFVEYKPYTVLHLLFHFVIFVITLIYSMKLHHLNRPVPDKPVSFAESDDTAD